METKSFNDIIKGSILDQFQGGSGGVSIPQLLLAIGLAFLVGLFVFYVYKQTFTGVLYSRNFNVSLVLLTMVATLIIRTVTSNLALSLGMVGALSIVRFRSAIKEPEELAYLFYTIAIGLGLGANQRVISVVAFLILMVIIWGRFFSSKKGKQQNLFLTVSSGGNIKPTMSQLNTLLENNFKAFHLSRYDESENLIEVSYWIEISKTGDIENFKNEVVKLSPEMQISFVDNKSF